MQDFLFRPKIRVYLAQTKPWLKFLSFNLCVITKQNFKHNSPNNHYQPDIYFQLLLFAFKLYPLFLQQQLDYEVFFPIHYHYLQNIAVLLRGLLSVIARELHHRMFFFSNRQTENIVSKPGFPEIPRDLAGLILAGQELKLKCVQQV